MNDDQVEDILLVNISLDCGTQIRTSINEEAIQRYTAMMKDEQGRTKLPPILLFRDDNGILWLVDGYHRTMATNRCQLETIRAIIRKGTKAEAIWEAAKVNSQNGVPLKQRDFRKAILMLSESYPDRSNSMIAEALSCTEGTVRYHLNQVRKIMNLHEENSTENRKVTGRDGKQYPAKQFAS
jgi:hypothetical protein